MFLNIPYSKDLIFFHTVSLKKKKAVNVSSEFKTPHLSLYSTTLTISFYEKRQHHITHITSKVQDRTNWEMA